jgi:pSer/pThr/pTyr-binding forkhead associated (FHA) protein
LADSRLNSIHLDPSRRQEFRDAREALLGARGTQTQALENRQGFPWASEVNNTAVQNLENRAPTNARFVLMDKEYTYPLKVGLNTIGRMPDNDVVLQDPYVSRRHCAILVHTGNTCEVHDIASKNGTFVNGRKIEGPTSLQSGDEIRMCGKQLVFLTKGDAQPAEGPGHHTTRME